MRYIKTAFIALALASAPALAEDCSGPDVPAIPDGATSTYDQMIEGMGSVKAFQTANSAYMECLEPMIAELTAAAKEGEISGEGKNSLSALEAKYNKAVSNEEELAGQFNTAIREHKAANPK